MFYEAFFVFLCFPNLALAGNKLKEFRDSWSMVYILLLLEVIEIMWLNDMTPSQNKKLMLVIRVESGCLGPNGANVIDDFCPLAQKEFASLYSDFIDWSIVPRDDRTLPEIDYYIDKKRLDSAKATKYLALFDQDLADIETALEEKLADLINGYLGY